MTSRRRPASLEPIAIVGIGCRFPGGAHGPDAFFDVMMRRVDAISEVPPDRWDWRAYFDPEQGKPGRTYARWGGFLDDIARFDAQAFGISPREAPHVDPQQRLLLEASWEALEDAGQPIRPSAPTSTGVFVGISTNDYNIIQARTPEVDPYTTPGTVMSIAANRISYCLNLVGPSVAVDTACSSSLVAVHSACRALQNEECETAIAAGVNCLILPYEFVAFSSMTMLSPEGRCRAFDARGAGFVRGEGVGAVVLKPLSKALAAGDRIYALVRGSGVNQDGRTNGMTVPSAEAQEALIVHVADEAGVSPGDLRYFEAHGTGTPVGDPIEARALGRALSRGRRDGDPCLVGSVKTNIGHLEAGAGIAGLIKTALSLHHGVIPPSLHFVTPNPNIDFEGLKLRVVTEPERYGDGPSLAGVNSFGFGGTNGHTLLEAAPRRERARLVAVTKADGSPRAELLVASARSKAALQGAAKALAARLDALESDTVPELCRTAATRRGHHEHRVAVVGGAASELSSGLAAFARGVPRPSVTSGQVSGAPPKLVFVYGGQGPQWWAMGRQLHASEPVFRAKLEECHEAMRAAGGFSLLDELLADEATSRMADTAVGQPSIFAIQVSLAALWASWGITPDAVVGHSVGEVAAVHAAGILDLASAMKVIYHRGRTMSHAPGGRMLAAGISGAEALRIAASNPEKVFVGAINSPTSVTLSGDGPALEEVMKVLEARGAFVRFLTVPYAFHSAQMDPVKDELLASIAGLEPRDAKLPILSTVTGAPAAGKDFGPEYWWKNVRQTVRFAPALERLAADGYSCFLELAPHPVLSTSIQECHGDRTPKAVVLPSLRRNTDERATMLTSLGGLYTLGFEPRWEGLWPRAEAGEVEPVALPGYAWQKERYWHEAASSLDARVRPSLHPLLTDVGRGAEPSWQGRLDPKLSPWLLAHVIEGRTVFPGAGYVELAIAAGRALAPDAAVVLEDVELERALFLPSGDDQAYVELTVRPAESTFAIASKVGDAKGDWTRHVNGKVRTLSGGTPVRVDRAAIASGLGEALDVDAFYTRFAETGLEFGPAFRTVKDGRRRDGEALARLVADPKLHGGRFTVHPALLDGCLQVVAAAARASDPRLQLPVSIERVRFHQTPPESFWAHATLHTQTRHGLFADIVAFDDDGLVLFEVRGFRARAVDGLGGAKPDDRLYELVWEPKPLPTAGAAQGAGAHAAPVASAQRGLAAGVSLAAL
ncbi:acyltransferase domain-containing protein, partial [Myxococcota bacterium]|nr:acyltransferase domain-containing protein [Myxococcota bacterium]